MANQIRGEWKVRARIPFKACPNCGDQQVFKVFEGEFDRHCFSCGWKRARKVTAKRVTPMSTVTVQPQVDRKALIDAWAKRQGIRI